MSKCETDFCDKIYVPAAIKEFRKLEKSLKKIPRVSKSLKLFTPKMHKTIRQGCINIHCNPSCKDTVMTTAKNTPEMTKLFKEAINAMPSSSANEKKFIVDTGKIVRNAMRKTIKAKYKQPLKNGFYKGLSSADIKMLKSSGATSGCSITLAAHMMNKANKLAKKTMKRR